MLILYFVTYPFANIFCFISFQLRIVISNKEYFYRVFLCKNYRYLSNLRAAKDLLILKEIFIDMYIKFEAKKDAFIMKLYCIMKLVSRIFHFCYKCCRNIVYVNLQMSTNERIILL